MVQGTMTANRLQKSKELTKDMEKKVIIFSVQKKMEIFIFTKIFYFSSKKYIFWKNVKFTFPLQFT